jgi:hypothetical protein
MARCGRYPAVSEILHNGEILKQGFLLAVVADVLESLVDNLLDINRVDVEVFRHDDKVEHVLQRNFLFPELFFQLAKFVFQPLQLLFGWLLLQLEDRLVRDFQVV